MRACVHIYMITLNMEDLTQKHSPEIYLSPSPKIHSNLQKENTHREKTQATATDNHQITTNSVPGKQFKNNLGIVKQYAVENYNPKNEKLFSVISSD